MYLTPRKDYMTRRNVMFFSITFSLVQNFRFPEYMKCDFTICDITIFSMNNGRLNTVFSEQESVLSFIKKVLKRTFQTKVKFASTQIAVNSGVEAE